MSITSDLRSYADTAVTEGRKALDTTLDATRAQFTDVAGSANDIVGKASDAVNEFRVNAEKVINIDAIRAAIEPYVAQARDYQVSVQHRAESILDELKKDPRFAKAISTADAVSDVVVDTVQERVVKPVQSLTGLGATRKPASKPAATTTKPAAKPAPSKSATARKTATTKPAAKKTAARKAPAKRATASSTSTTSTKA